MDKVKIQEIADEAGLQNGDLLEKAKDLGFDVKAANCTISMENAGILVDYAISGTLPAGFKKPSDKKKIKVIKKKESVKNENIFKTVVNDKEDNKMENEEKNNQIELDEKKKKLQQYHTIITKERDQLQSDKLKFEQYKKEQENSLKESLVKKELDHKTKLAEEKIKTITQLKTEFLENIEDEYSKLTGKLDELIKKELKLIEWQQNLDQEQKTYSKEKELFESEKEKLLNLHKQELEKEKEIFINQQEKERTKKLEEINKTIENLYQKKEQYCENKEVELREKEADLKTKIAEVLAKENYLVLQSETIYKQEKEKVEEEIKSYQAKVKSFEKQNQSLREELSDLRDELDSYEKFEDRDLPRELDEKQKEISRLNKLLTETTEIKNDLKIDIDKLNRETEEKRKVLYLENENLKKSIEDTERFRSENELLKEKVNSNRHHIEFLGGEKRKLEENLHSIFSQGKEKELRIEDIKKVPYKEIKLESEININEEIKYLDSIESNMKQYGVEYPQRLLYAFHTAIKSAEFSPLTVLSGVSGTGKSELPKLFSHFGGFNFLAEAVQPTWDSPESMMGYYNTIENKFDSTNILKFLLQTSQSKSETPFGLSESMNMILLDEMNLAHIELYFAEFLSKFELRRGTKGVNLDIKLGTGMNYHLPLDKNVLWIGTMNEDETTKSLSDKVLDRSFSINFPRPDKLKSRDKIRTLDEIKEFEYLNRDTWDNWIQKKSLFTDEKTEVIQKYKEMSNEINKYLAPTGRAIGHRVWQSMEYYINNHPLVIQNKEDEDALVKNVKLAFEEQLVQKIMPKLRGIEVHGKEKESLDSIRDILNQNDFKITEDFELSMDNPYGQFIWNSANYLKED